jgi:hypothetical protein
MNHIEHRLAAHSPPLSLSGKALSIDRSTGARSTLKLATRGLESTILLEKQFGKEVKQALRTGLRRRHPGESSKNLRETL